MTGQDLRNFINENKTQIDNKEFRAVYDKLFDETSNLTDMSLFTRLLYKSGINPLKFLDTIPE